MGTVLDRYPAQGRISRGAAAVRGSSPCETLAGLDFCLDRDGASDEGLNVPA